MERDPFPEGTGPFPLRFTVQSCTSRLDSTMVPESWKVLLGETLLGQNCHSTMETLIDIVRKSVSGRN